MKRFYFYPQDKTGKVVDVGGYTDGTREQAEREARQLCVLYGYAKVEVREN